MQGGQCMLLSGTQAGTKLECGLLIGRSFVHKQNVHMYLWSIDKHK